MSEIKTRLTADMKTAMKAGEKGRLGVIRMLLAAIKQREVDERRELADADLIAVLDKQAKQRRESLEQYRKAGRDDLADTEAFELTVIESYLPQPLTAEELEALIQKAIDETGASAMADMGKVMNLVRDRAAGRADMSQVSAQVRQRLA
ncbi:MAG: GatB/YqeY domain-containing protein [Halothiobacillaceae bacterium]